MVESIKISFLTYFRHLDIYDYLALAWFGLTFLALILLAIFLAKRSSYLSLLLIILALIFFIIAPFALKFKTHALLRSHTIELQLVKKLTFSDSVIVEATLLNTSKQSYNFCLFQTKLIKKTPTEGIKSFLATLKPLAKQSILVEANVPQGEVFEFKTIFENFSYSGEIDANIQAECYK